MTVSELACGSRQLSFRSEKKAMGSHRFCTKVDFCTHEKIESQQGARENLPRSFRAPLSLFFSDNFSLCRSEKNEREPQETSRPDEELLLEEYTADK